MQSHVNSWIWEGSFAPLFLKKKKEKNSTVQLLVLNEAV